MDIHVGSRDTLLWNFILFFIQNYFGLFCFKNTLQWIRISNAWTRGLLSWDFAMRVSFVEEVGKLRYTGISTAADVSPRSRCFLRHKDMGQADIFHMSHGDLHPFQTVYEGFIRCSMLQHHPIRKSPHVCPDKIKKLVNMYIGFGSAPVIKGHWERNAVGNLWSKRRTRNDGRDDSDQINAIFLGEFPSCLLS